jgi:hypothetical protein
MTRLFVKLYGKRGVALAVTAVGAVLAAKGHGFVHPDGLQDGPA